MMRHIVHHSKGGNMDIMEVQDFFFIIQSSGTTKFGRKWWRYIRNISFWYAPSGQGEALISSVDLHFPNQSVQSIDQWL